MLTEAEIAVGTVAYFDAKVLNANPQVCGPASEPTDGRPFVCLAVSNGLCIWMPLTTKPGPDRSHLEIPQSVRRGGSGVWVTGPSFANKDFGTYIGPASAFVAASAGLDDCNERNRPSIQLSFVQRELIPRCRERGGLDFARWKPKKGAIKESPASEAVKLGRPLLTASVREKLVPPQPIAPTAEKKQEPVVPSLENWATFIDSPTNGKGRKGR